MRGFCYIYNKFDRLIDMASAQAQKKSIFKNPLFWVGGCLTLIIVFVIIAIVAFLIIRSMGSSTGDYQVKLTNVWQVTINDAEDLIDKTKEVSNEGGLAALAAEVNDFADSAKEQKSDIKALEAPPEYLNYHQELIDSYEKLDEYLDDFYDALNKEPKQLTSNSFDATNDSADEADQSFEDALTNIDFLDNLPPLLFKMHITLSPIYEDIWAKQDTAKKQEEQKKANEEKKQQQQADLKKAEQVVDSFCTYWINSNVSQMRNILSGEALKEFNPDIEFQGDFERVGYSVISREITDKGNYRFYVYIQSQDFEQIKFTDEYKIIVGDVGSELKIIRRKYVKRVD